MLTLYFDTETTGKANFALPAGPDQPRMVSLAAVLADEKTEHALINLLIYPEDYEIPEEAAKIHGITTAHAQRAGVPVKTALQIFAALTVMADKIVAFNADFDSLVVNSERVRLGREMGAGKGYIENHFGVYQVQCAMKEMTPICKLPGRRNGEYKWPLLVEAYHHCFKVDFEQTHDALDDVTALRKIWNWYNENRIH